MTLRSFFNMVKGNSVTQSLTALGVLAAGLLLSEVNLLSSRHYIRMDFSEGSRFSLSSATAELVGGLNKEVELIVLLGAGDPLLGEVRQLLEGYQALSSRLKIRFVDPDRDAAEFLALGSKFDLGTDEIVEGGVIADASFLLLSGERTWFIRQNQLTQVDADGNIQSRVEEQLTEGIAQTLEQKEASVCFVTGHGERSIDDNALEGLRELARRLGRSNLIAKRIPLDVPSPQESLADCDAIAVVGPARPYSQKHERLLQEAHERGSGLLLFLDPIVSDDGALISTGLEALTRQAGIISTPAFILESDPTQRLPQGLGEAFFAIPTAHPLTRGLSSETARVDARVMVVAAGPLQKTPSSQAQEVLTTSDSATTVTNLSNAASRSINEKDARPVFVAMAHEIPRPKRDQNADRRGARTVVVGTSNLAWNRSFTDPALYGNRVFVENAFSWVLQRPSLVSVPKRAPMGAGMNLTEESLSSLLRYVLIYMPLAAACAGFFVLTRRRRAEEVSRRSQERDE